MEQVVLVVHLLIALALVGVILLQKTDGGALGGLGGMAGGGASFGGLFTARGGANFLTRTTAILAACFIATSLLLAILSSAGERDSSVLEALPTETPTAPTAPSAMPDEAPAPAEPPAPAAPQAPIAN